MKKILLVMMVLLVGVFPTFAQDDGLSSEERELIAVVTESYEKLLQVTTYQSTAKQNTTQHIVLGGAFPIELDQQTTQDMEMHVRMDGANTDMYSIVEQTISSTSAQTGSTEMSMVIESIWVDGEYYLRYTEAPPESAAFLPQGWTKAADIPGMEILDLDQLFETMAAQNQLAAFNLTEDKVESIQELESETVDGVEVRVFDIVWKPDAFMEIAGSGLLDMSSLGVDTEQFLSDMYSNSTYHQILKINTETGLPYQVDFQMVTEDVELTVQGTTMTLSQTSVITTTLFGFDEPVTIEVPTLGE